MYVKRQKLWRFSTNERSFYRNRCVIYHFNLALYDIRKRYKNIANEENLGKRQSVIKMSILIVKFLGMKHCFKKMNVDKAKFLFNGKNLPILHIFITERRKTFIISNESGVFELKHKHNNNKTYILFEIIFCIHYII